MTIYKKDLVLTKNDIVSLSLDEWSDDVTIAYIEDFINYLYDNPLIFENINDAFDIIERIESFEISDDDLNGRVDPYEYERYRNFKLLVSKLYYVGFKNLSQEGLKLCLDKYFFELLTLDKDLRYSFKELLERFYEEDGSWKAREYVLKYFFDSEALIGSTKLNVGKGFESVEPTIHNWILDYIGRAGNEVGTALGLVSYLNQSQNVANLSSDDLSTLKKVLELYDFIKYHLEEPLEDPELAILEEKVKESNQKLQELAERIEIENEKKYQEEETSYEEEGINQTEEQVITTAVGQSGILSAPARVMNEPEYTIDDLHKEYGLYISKHPEARAREQMISQTIGNNKASAVALMQEYIDAKDITGVHALLRSAAQNGFILDLIIADAKYAREYWENINTLFGEQYSSKDSFMKKPAPYASVFMQWVFRVVFGLEAIETSFIGVDIYNVLVAIDPTSFEKLMYADITAKQFRWRRIGKNKETLGFK